MRGCGWSVCSFLVFQSTKLLERSNSSINAKAASKKKKKTVTSSSGGFGAPKPAPKRKTPPAFPPLEPDVLETLLPAKDGQLVDSEILGRLSQIYGFADFNLEEYETATPEVEEVSQPSFLLEDESNSDGIDLDSLLAVATGGTAKTSISSPKITPPSSTSTTAPSFLQDLAPFSNVRVLHTDPMVLMVPEFFTTEECDRYVAVSATALSRQSPTVGKDATARAQRTSTTYYHHFHQVPELMAKASRLLGVSDLARWEEPQTVRYESTQQFTWHLDALGPTESTLETSGQRIATLLVYLNEVPEGGATCFRDLNLQVQPERGAALLFFPSAGGIPDTPIDIRTLHCGSPAQDTTKWIAQLWFRQRPYQPTAPPGNSIDEAMENMEEYCRGSETE